MISIQPAFLNRMGDVLLGCSGWDYEEWIGPFYQAKKGSKLAAYSKVFRTAEINSTFYRAPTPGMVLGWVRYTPEEFVFSAKVPQTVTHDKLLKVDSRAQEDLLDFCDLMSPLLEAGKLGPLLLQLPPRLRFDCDRTRAFFEHLPEEFRFAIEFRNESWMCEEALDLLREFKVAYTVVDEPLLPPDVHVTADVAYFRWHGHGRDPWYNYRYSRAELVPWVPRIEKAAGASKALYGYFNNHFHGYAPENCLEVLEMLGVLDLEQRKALKSIRDFRKGIVRTARGRVRTTTLEEFAGGGEADVEALLRRMTTSPRLERARRIAEGDVKVEVAEGTVTAQVGAYIAFIDANRRVLRHDCEDWKKNLQDGPLCKHLCALFMRLPKERSAQVLEELRVSRDRWVLES
jgi:uncharacterized protein YecE (DUF72 family)